MKRIRESRPVAVWLKWEDDVRADLGEITFQIWVKVSRPNSQGVVAPREVKKSILICRGWCSYILYCILFSASAQLRRRIETYVYFRVRNAVKLKWENNARMDLLGCESVNWITVSECLVWFFGFVMKMDVRIDDSLEFLYSWVTTLRELHYKQLNNMRRIEECGNIALLFGSYFIILLYLFHGSYVVCQIASSWWRVLTGYSVGTCPVYGWIKKFLVEARGGSQV